MNSATATQPASSVAREPDKGADDLAAFDRLWAQVALIGIIICFCNAAVYYPLRLGLATPVLLVPACFLVFSAALLAPLLIPARGVFGGPAWRMVAMPLAALLVFWAVLLAFLLGPSLLVLFAGLALAGAWRAVQLLRATRSLAVVFCLFVGCV
ncbi:MAG TPA: hypothetical protein VHA37_08775, partial [Candidatus Saccharimonadales bacterium]|nr:hypothetical protein [Candidatus Saccharimonadales bacterium]